MRSRATAARIAGRVSARRQLETGTAERLLAEVRAEAVHADGKASILIGAMGACIAFLAGVRPQQGGADGWWTVGCCLAAVGFMLLLAALAPRRGRRGSYRHVLSHFGDIRSAAASGQLPEALRRTEQHPEAGMLLALDAVSHIVVVKYRLITAALACCTIAMPALILGAVHT